MMELQVMEVEIHLDHFNIFRIYVLSNFWKFVIYQKMRIIKKRIYSLF
jgi:hypothetical protein